MNLLRKENLALKRKQKSLMILSLFHMPEHRRVPSIFLFSFMDILMESCRSMCSLSVMKIFLVPGKDVKLT